jgi:hypothetical protein
MIANQSLRALGLASGLLLWVAAAQAGPISVGVSHQVQVGWVQSSQSGTRLTRVLEQGTAGRNIRPDSANGRFQLTGSPFQPDDPNDSFEYRSILRDTTTVSDVQSGTLTIYATQSNTYNILNTPALGSFQQGNAAFSMFGP